MTNATWTSLRVPLQRAVRLLDGFAVAAWLLLAVMLLTVTVGSALGVFNVGKVTLNEPGLHPAPAQPAHWQPPRGSAP